MKLVSQRGEVLRSEELQEQQFKIQTTAKAFEILSSSLYTDPYTAIVRELSCNAADSHMNAGNSSPFMVHLPNELEPWLAVIDYGTGLSHNDVMTLYTTYFDSTKTESNLFTGALGLGSKSPFAYSQTFSVISRFNGRKATYTAFVNESGVPSIALLTEVTAAGEPNGLEVRVPVQRKDFSTFVKAAAEVLPWFDIRPNVVGVVNWSWNPHIPTRPKNSRLTFTNDSYMGKSVGIYAVQGNVAYKLDFDKIFNKIPETDKTLLFTSIFSPRVRHQTLISCWFDIGDLDFAANREEVRYDDRNVGIIVNRLNEYVTGIITQINKHASKLTGTNWEMAIALRTWILKNGILPEDVIGIINKCSRQGKQGMGLTDKASKLFNSMWMHVYSTLGYRVSIYQSGMEQRMNLSGDVPLLENSIAVLNEDSTHGFRRVKQYLKTNKTGAHKAVVITKNKAAKKLESVMPDGTKVYKKYEAADYDKDYQHIMLELAEPVVFPLDQLIAKVSSKSIRPPLMLSHMVGNQWVRDAKATELPKGPGLYVILYADGSTIIHNGNQSERSGTNFSAINIEVMIKLLNVDGHAKYGFKSKITSDQVIAISPTQERYVKNDPNWQELTSLALPLIVQYSPLLRHHVTVVDNYAYQATGGGWQKLINFVRQAIRHDMFDMIPRTSLIHRYIIPYMRNQESADKLPELSSLYYLYTTVMSLFNKKLTKHIKIDKVDYCGEVVRNRYPLISKSDLSPRDMNKKMIQHMVDYVIAVENNTIK